ncbi:MAG: hypothetical protein AABY22_25480 [Nanoarchaeota archaeon]
MNAVIDAPRPKREKSLRKEKDNQSDEKTKEIIRILKFLDYCCGGNCEVGKTNQNN